MSSELLLVIWCPYMIHAWVHMYVGCIFVSHSDHHDEVLASSCQEVAVSMEIEGRSQ